MARVGLNNFKYSKLDETGDTPKYNGAKSLGKAVDCNVSIENNNAELYAEDSIAESDYSFNKGTISLTVDEADSKIFAELLGHEYSSEGGEVIKKDTDTAPYVGVGRILTKIVNGVYKYKVEFLCKVKFAEPSQDDKTRGESLEFATTTIEGTIAKLADGTWSKSKEFTTKEAAVEYLTSLMAVSK